MNLCSIIEGYHLFLLIRQEIPYHIQTMSTAMQQYIFTEARTEMIHGQLESGSSSTWLAHPNLSHLRRKILLASRTCVINTEMFADKKTENNTQNTETRNSQLPAENNVPIHNPPGSSCLFFSVLHATATRCCRFFGSLANSWRAVTSCAVL